MLKIVLEDFSRDWPNKLPLSILNPKFQIAPTILAFLSSHFLSRSVNEAAASYTGFMVVIGMVVLPWLLTMPLLLILMFTEFGNFKPLKVGKICEFDIKSFKIWQRIYVPCVMI